MTEQLLDSKSATRRGWIVTFSGTGINLALGALYTWSVISKNIPAAWGWSEGDKSLPYMFACLMFSLIMVPAGRMQDKMGPRIVAAIGGLLVGLGFILASLTSSLLVFVIGFGILAGAGIGFGYASCTPPAVKWFPAVKTGLISGIVVSGFGLASVYASPLTEYLITSFSFKTAIMSLGIAFLVIIVGLSNLLKAPPAGFEAEKKNTDGKPAAAAKTDYRPVQMLKTPQFYLIWFMYACSAGAGLMIISKLAAIAITQAGTGIALAAILVAVLAIGNGGGRILAGMLSDKIGRKMTMLICFILQAGLIMLLSQVKQGSFLANPIVLAVISALIGANYGAILSLFPSITKDFYGLKNFGVNYGLVFTSWGVGGFMLSFLAGSMYDKFKTFSIAYYGAAILLVLAAILVFFVKPPKKAE